MEAMDLIYARRSCRRFDGRPLPLEDLRRIADSATVAPTGLSKNELVYVVLTGTVASNYLELVRKLQGGNAYYGGTSLILIVRDRERGGLYDIDAGCAIQNMYLAACDMGYGVCNLHLARGLFASPEGRNFQVSELKLPLDRYEVLESMVFGYPLEEHEPNRADEERVIVR